MIDLHLHSTESDGTDSPARIVDMAAEKGCTAIALTDHDSLEGIAEARDRAAERGIELVSGCELSCRGADELHLLAYFVEPVEGPLQDELAVQQRQREGRNRQLAARLTELGVPVTYEEMLAEAGGRGVGRPHAAAVMMRKGLVSSVHEAFEMYLGKGRPGHVERAEEFPVASAIDLIHRSGGVAVLAHPLSLTAGIIGGLDALVRELVDAGLDGMECLYGRYEDSIRRQLQDLARRHDLAVSGGSDHHGDYKPDLAVGVGRGDLEVPDELLPALAARRPG